MFDTDRLHSLLASGHSAEDIVALFTSSLNEAEAQIKKEEEERKAREAEAAKCQELEATKRADFMEATANLLAAIGKHYPELAIEITDEVTGPVTDLIIMSIDLEGLRGRRPVKFEVKPVKVEEAKKMDDVFGRFFKQFGLS